MRGERSVALRAHSSHPNRCFYRAQAVERPAAEKRRRFMTDGDVSRFSCFAAVTTAPAPLCGLITRQRDGGGFMSSTFTYSTPGEGEMGWRQGICDFRKGCCLVLPINAHFLLYVVHGLLQWASNNDLGRQRSTLHCPLQRVRQGLPIATPGDARLPRCLARS